MVWVHGACGVVIRRHLPAREINRFNARLGLLHRLAASECAQTVHIPFFR
ncbi:Uncharacterised protein [Vibrio cholerae]|nr:Uncharacterised protein [Vibrio cholerae]